MVSLFLLKTCACNVHKKYIKWEILKIKECKYTWGKHIEK